MVSMLKQPDTIAPMTPRRAFTIGYQGADADELAGVGHGCSLGRDGVLGRAAMAASRNPTRASTSAATCWKAG